MLLTNILLWFWIPFWKWAYNISLKRAGGYTICYKCFRTPDPAFWHKTPIIKGVMVQNDKDIKSETRAYIFCNECHAGTDITSKLWYWKRWYKKNRMNHWHIPGRNIWIEIKNSVLREHHEETASGPN